MTKRVLRIFLTSAVPYGLLVGYVMTAQWGLGVGVLWGLVVGAFFGVATVVYLEAKRRRMRSRDGLFEGAAVLREGPASHLWKGTGEEDERLESRGGWLTLTGQALAFRPRPNEARRAPVDVPLADIVACHRKGPAEWVSQGLRVELKDGREEHFVVHDCAEWMKLIEDVVAAGEDDGKGKGKGAGAASRRRGRRG